MPDFRCPRCFKSIDNYTKALCSTCSNMKPCGRTGCKQMISVNQDLCPAHWVEQESQAKSGTCISCGRNQIYSSYYPICNQCETEGESET
jgi:hypothetical protein